MAVLVAATLAVPLSFVTERIASDARPELSLGAGVGYVPHFPSLECRGGIGSCLTVGDPLLPGLGIIEVAGLLL